MRDRDASESRSNPSRRMAVGPSSDHPTVVTSRSTSESPAAEQPRYIAAAQHVDGGHQVAERTLAAPAVPGRPNWDEAPSPSRHRKAGRANCLASSPAAQHDHQRIPRKARRYASRAPWREVQCIQMAASEVASDRRNDAKGPCPNACAESTNSADRKRVVTRPQKEAADSLHGKVEAKLQILDDMSDAAARLDHAPRETFLYPSMQGKRRRETQRTNLIFTMPSESGKSMARTGHAGAA